MRVCFGENTLINKSLISIFQATEDVLTLHVKLWWSSRFNAPSGQ